MLNSLPKHSGIYFVKDDINNLQFKIQFRCISTLLKLPKYEIPGNLNQGAVNKNGLKNVKNDEVKDDTKVVTIKWQQKLLSPTECELYSDLKNCTSDQQKKYNLLLKQEQEAKDRRQTKRKRHRKLRPNPELENTHFGPSENLIFTYVQEDNFQSVEKDPVLAKSNMDEPFEVMFVYADLKPDTQLIILKWFNSDRLLYIYPDFTDFHNQPYFIEIDSDYRHLYSYGIEDISLKQLGGSKSEQEQFLYLPELPTQWRFEDDLCQKFAMPPKRTQRWTVLFTVNELDGFEYDNIHLRYHIKLPDNTILEEGLLDATSHTVSNNNSNLRLHIGLTWQITVLCEEQFDPSQNLRIFFEIISIDTWQRERFEGFCFLSLNLLQPCTHHTLQLQCIRPVDSLLESINRYFIGGRRKFDYVRFVCENANDDDSSSSNVHCRYGVRMQNSGKFNLTYQTLRQRNCELLNPCPSRTSGMTLDDIMMAYKEARRRLEAVAFN